MHGLRMYAYPADGPLLGSERDATELIGLARGHQASFVTVPVERFGDDFFQLKTGAAGVFIQKFVTYGVRIAIIGDIADYLRNSSALRDFVYEANRGKHVWFLESHTELKKRLQSELSL